MLNKVKEWFSSEGWVDIGFGVFAAIFVPHFITLQNLPWWWAQNIFWGFSFFFGTVFVKRVFQLPKQVEKQTQGLRLAINDALSSYEKRLGKTFYKGFYTLLAGDDLKNGLEQLDNALSDSTIKGGLRDLVFGFLAKSISNIGESGLAMVNASVSEYVEFLRRTLSVPDLAVRATCVVRPYWFVSEEIPKISLSPDEKANHLPLFRRHLPSPLRILVVDEVMIVEMFLTAFIDMEIFRNTDCPLCKTLNRVCLIHTERPKEGCSQIPEIQWFEKNVNDGVDLKYSHVHSSFRESCSEFEDRVYITDNRGLQIDIRFNFTNLSMGIMWLKWGDKAQEFPQCTPRRKPGIFDLQLRARKEPHALYNSFWDGSNITDCLLRTGAFDKPPVMRNYLQILFQLVDQHFNEDQIKDIQDAEVKALLANGAGEFGGVIKTAITTLQGRLPHDGKGDIRSAMNGIYQEILGHYRENGIPGVSYVVTHDKRKPEFPVRVACWKKNWEKLTARS